MRKLYIFKGDVYEFEQDGSQDYLITADYVALTELEIDQYTNPGKYISDEEKYQLYLKSLRPLTRRQFRMILVLNGYDLDAIKAQILAIEDIQTRQLTLINWEDADTFERLDTSLIMMAEMMGMSDDQVNAMWEQALML